MLRRRTSPTGADHIGLVLLEQLMGEMVLPLLPDLASGPETGNTSKHWTRISDIQDISVTSYFQTSAHGSLCKRVKGRQSVHDNGRGERQQIESQRSAEEQNM
jgi:hypothetical protein